MYLNSAPGLPGFCWNWGDSKIEQNDRKVKSRDKLRVEKGPNIIQKEQMHGKI